MATLFEQLTGSLSNVRSRESRASASPRPAANLLELRLPPGWPEHGAVDWCLHTGNGIAAQGRVKNLVELPGEAKAARLHVWAPAMETLLTAATLPTRMRAKIERALPYTLEDRLLGDPGELFFAYSRQPDKSLAVAVTARGRLRAWLDALAEAGLHPISLSPSILAMPTPMPDHAWMMSFAGSEAWVRTGERAGFACPVIASTPPAILVAALGDAREKEQAPETLVVTNPPADFDADAWARALEVEILPQESGFWETTGALPPALNLLQGEFAPKRQSQYLPVGLRPAAVLLGLWLLGTLGFNGWEWWRLSSEHHHLYQEMTRIFQKSFPKQAKTIVDPAGQMQRNLDVLLGQGSSPGGNDLLPLLGRAAPVLGGQAQTQLQTIKYRNNALTLSLQLPDFRALEAIKSALRTNALIVEVLSANSEAEGVSARLRMKTSAKVNAK